MFQCFYLSAQHKNIFSVPDSLNKKREQVVNYSVLIAYPITMYGLYELWYKDYPQSKFHFFNDGPEWLQMDKTGHFVTAYNITKGMSNVYEWCGLKNSKANNRAMAISLAYQTTIELFDGFSSEWGFSWADVAGNLGGTGFFYLQQKLWQEQRVKLKFSFHQTGYPQYRKNILGSTFIEQPLKDYNGQTYWLSLNVKSFMNEKSRVPAWLCIAAGYGVDGLTGANENPTMSDGKNIPVFTRRRQFYVGLDIDLSKIKTKKIWLHNIFSVINLIRLPLPAFEFNQSSGTNFYPLYF